MSLKDLFYRERDKSYERDVQAEAEFWNTHHSGLLSIDARPSMQRYLNERLSGHADRKWYETISDQTEVRHGCILGAGPGKLEASLLQRHTDLQLTIYDIAEDALHRLVESLPDDLKQRVETRQDDLNFVELPAESYDIVVAQSCIHHIVNLEHLAFQVNLSLKSAGQFFMYDVVSESFFQFEEKKKRLYDLLINASGDGRSPPQRVNWPDRSNWTFSPFESVRSSDILSVFGSYLEEASLRTAGSLIGLAIFGRSVQRSDSRLTRAVRRILNRALDMGSQKEQVAHGLARGGLLFELDGLCCDTGYLKPGLAFAVYRKRPNAP